MASERPRAITPFEPFDSRPKLKAVDPIDPFVDIPRPPRVPSYAHQLHQPTIEPRDTIPADPLGDTDLSSTDETPRRHILSPIDQLCLDVSEMKLHCQKAADAAIEAVSFVKELRDDVRALDRRVSRLEASNLWFPTVVSLAALAFSVLGFVLHH